MPTFDEWLKQQNLTPAAQRYAAPPTGLAISQEDPSVMAQKYISGMDIGSYKPNIDVPTNAPGMWDGLGGMMKDYGGTALKAGELGLGFLGYQAAKPMYKAQTALLEQQVAQNDKMSKQWDADRKSAYESYYNKEYKNPATTPMGLAK